MDFRGIYGITDSTLTPGENLLAAAGQALAGGISVLQYRDKSAAGQQRLDLARALQALCAQHQVPLVINDDVQLCLACGAAGVHLGQGDTGLLEARALLGNQAIIGVTCHADLRLARQAQDAGASYVAFGRFYPSHTKPAAPPAPLAILREAKQQLSVPIVAIGGIDAGNAGGLLTAGADMLAVINYLFGSGNVTARAEELSSIYNSYLHNQQSEH